MLFILYVVYLVNSYICGNYNKYNYTMNTEIVDFIISEKKLGNICGRPRIAKKYSISESEAEKYISIANYVLSKENSENVTNEMELFDLSAQFLEFEDGCKEEDLPPTLILNSSRILVMSDLHIPYHDKPSILSALEYGKRHKVDCIYLNGDIIDCYQQSRFEKSRDMRNFKDELTATRQFLELIRRAFGDIPIYYKFGNHEDRHERYIEANAAVLGIEEFLLENLLHFGRHQITCVPTRQVAKVADLYICHGHESQSFLRGGVNAARTTAINAGVNLLCGHTHKTSTHIEQYFDKSIKVDYTGCLCKLNPRYTGRSKYTNGFAGVFVNDGVVVVENIKL